MCQVDQFKRPLVVDLLKDKDYLKLIHKEDEQLNQIKQEKDLAMQSIMIFNHNARYKNKKKNKEKLKLLDINVEVSDG